MAEAASSGSFDWLAYLHPLWMLFSLAACLMAFRVGLGIRRARAAGRPPPRDARARHLRLAKPAVAAIALGFGFGAASVFWLRDWTPLSSFHALLGGVALVLFMGAALQGNQLERGELGAREAHARLAAAAIAIALAGAVAGFVLLP